MFSHDVTAAMLVSQNKEMAAMLVSLTKPLGVELYFYANTFFCLSKPAGSHVNENALYRIMFLLLALVSF